MGIKNSFPALLLLLIVSTGERTFAQPGDMRTWRALFEKPFDKIHAANRFLWDAICQKPPSEVKGIIHALDDDKKVNNSDKTSARMSLLKSMYCRVYDSLYDNEGWEYWGNRSVSGARNTEDDYIMQGCCLFLGDAYLRMNNYDTAIFYLLKTVELSEKLGYNEDFIVANKIAVSNALYRTQNYRQCINFCVSNYDIESNLVPITVMSAYNNAGLSYLELNNPDSAIYYFNKGQAYAARKKWGVWEGIMLGNMGMALHQKGEDDKAIIYWQRNYDSSFKYKEWGNAASTLAYISEYEFNHGRQAQAISHLQLATAADYSDRAPDPQRRILIYKVKSYCYRKLNRHDSADYFLDEHYRILDSVHQVISRNKFNWLSFAWRLKKVITNIIF
ncbi:MAG: hypothetical protein JWR61_1345 [Ferruginibacter sp.]|uniref:tetratricopeptide repeat protein n=1 Tax=Ferruginibacter sp. TaxID=1940288 RepID=UPI00265A6169|nr:tetratricopeptide repeat protein [Ferruginibacter sp.]MDB5276390.1 hypothetical protein [Ferruginibacter sp.]